MSNVDITVEENIYECEVCTETLTGPSYRVVMDFRSPGFFLASQIVQVACERCAKNTAAGIHASLVAQPSQEGQSG